MLPKNNENQHETLDNIHKTERKAVEPDTTRASDDELMKQVRSIMMDWEDHFPYPEPEDAGLEANITYDTAKNILQLIHQHTQKAVEEALDKANKSVNGALYVGLGRDKTIAELNRTSKETDDEYTG